MLAINEPSTVAGATKHSSHRRRTERSGPSAPERSRVRFSRHDAAVCEVAFPTRGRRPRSAKGDEPTAVPVVVQPAAKKGVPRSAGIPKAEKFFHLYLREVGRVRALSPAKQVELAVRAGGGDKQARGQLLQAVERFDAVKEGDFHTFASWWVHRAIKRALAREPKPVPVPIRFMARPVRALVGSG